MHCASRANPAQTFAPTDSVPDLEYSEERLLGDLDAADLLHPLLPLLLLLEEFALARDVAAVALRRDVLAHGLDGFAGDDAVADRRLDGDLELLPRDELAQLLGHLPTPYVRFVGVDDDAERIDRIAIDHHI